MSAKRIIPCLDVKDGRVVKGIKFKSLRDAGDPAELALRYEDEGADEIVFLDITASSENREMMREVVRRTAENLFVPLTVGGGLRTLDDISRTLDAGADRVSLNTSAVRSPEFIRKAVETFGSQCIVLAIDAKKKGDSWVVYTHGGRTETEMELLDWAATGERMGAGEILLTSMDADGTKQGYDTPQVKAVTERVRIPVIASGGCGTMEHIYEVLKDGADAALAASIFHYETIRIQDLKMYLDSKGVEVRLKG